MILLVAFWVLVIIAQTINVIITLQVERFAGGAALFVFFALLVVGIVGSWLLAVRLTEPRAASKEHHA